MVLCTRRSGDGTNYSTEHGMIYEAHKSAMPRQSTIFLVDVIVADHFTLLLVVGYRTYQ